MKLPHGTVQFDLENGGVANTARCVSQAEMDTQCAYRDNSEWIRPIVFYPELEYATMYRWG